MKNVKILNEEVPLHYEINCEYGDAGNSLRYIIKEHILLYIKEIKNNLNKRL